MKYISLLLFIASFSFGQSIYLDEDFSDWLPITDTVEDQGDNNSLDIESLSIANDANNLYIRIKLDREILLQTDNDLTLDIETADRNFEYRFGERYGIIRDAGPTTFVDHDEIDLVISPTVTSDEFEIQISRTWADALGLSPIAGEIQVKVYNNRSGGDAIPDAQGTYSYTMASSIDTELPAYTLARNPETEIRVCSYNVLRDRLFSGSARNAYENILSTVMADIYCFQEIYDHSSSETLIRLDGLGVLEGGTDNWYHSKRGSDNILISRYPIIYSREISGNGVFVINMNGQEMVLLNLHLSCCDRDSEREGQIDPLLAFLRDAQNGTTNYDLSPETPVIICGDMNFVGNSDQVAAFIKGDIFNNNQYGADFEIDWDANGLTDLKPFVTNSNKTYTWYDASSSFSAGRLDYLFYSDSNISALNSYVLDTRTFDSSELENLNLEAEDTEVASDHLPIVTDFKLEMEVATLDLASETLRLYPNPAHDWIQIESINPSEQFNILNLQGQLLSHHLESRIKVSHLESGLYLLHIVNPKKGASSIQKFCISR